MQSPPPWVQSRQSEPERLQPCPVLGLPECWVGQAALLTLAFQEHSPFAHLFTSRHPFPVTMQPGVRLF